MEYQAINLKEKLAILTERWSPRTIAAVNDYHLKIVKVQGEFVWHSHAETDEVFLVLAGNLTIEFRDGSVKLAAGELYVVPRGVEHKPIAESECEMMLIEPAGTVNTGDAGGAMTAATGVWL